MPHSAVAQGLPRSRVAIAHHMDYDILSIIGKGLCWRDLRGGRDRQQGFIPLVPHTPTQLYTTRTYHRAHYALLPYRRGRMIEHRFHIFLRRGQ